MLVGISQQDTSTFCTNMLVPYFNPCSNAHGRPFFLKLSAASIVPSPVQVMSLPEAKGS